ncbi:MAG TPA: hypothetical protein VH044_14030 [Polyangiaceae bacterium]|jgi:hypothetical protein|nr:hypothetical protein [Polyangiaceae bacterium]
MTERVIVRLDGRLSHEDKWRVASEQDGTPIQRSGRIFEES